MSAITALREEVCEANRGLARLGLVALTWGNVSGISAERDRVVIKPSGVPYEKLRPSDMVVLGLDGTLIEGSLRPSTDTPTHLVLYQSFPSIGGVTHTHSPYACMFAQARREIPCLGTTHADHFPGPVPLTRQLTPEEVAADYEASTGRAIADRFRGTDPIDTPGVLLPGHGPFCWGRSARESLDNATALESVARMAFGTMIVAGHAGAPLLEPFLLVKHHQRKHGPRAYYGQRSH